MIAVRIAGSSACFCLLDERLNDQSHWALWMEHRGTHRLTTYILSVDLNVTVADISAHMATDGEAGAHQGSQIAP